MSAPDRPRALADGGAPWPRLALRTWLLRTIPGRLLLIGFWTKLLLALLGWAIGGLPGWLEIVDGLASLAIIFGCAYGLVRAITWTRRRLLWRVRRKLILSYVFVGLVPGLLIITFFLLAGLLLFFNVSSYLVQSRVRALAEEARFVAESMLLDLERSGTAADFATTLERRQESAETRYPFLSVAIVPAPDLRCAERSDDRTRRPRNETLPLLAGPWRHLEAPERLPAWMTCDGFVGVMAYEAEPSPSDPGSAEDTTGLVMRAVSFRDVREPGYALILDLPLSSALAQRIRGETGIAVGDASIMPVGNGQTPVRLPHGQLVEPIAARAAADEGGGFARPWVVFLDYRDWDSGAEHSALVAITIHVWEMYDRISAISSTRMTSVNFAQLLLVVLALVGALFLVIQCVALVIGVVLARQITGAIHDLFTGTQYLRNRHFTHQIPVRADDQLGELAESFNTMTGEITALLVENAKKERLEQELRTARDIQMKLLPQGPLRVPGLDVSAYCEPAREVGGDYYDCMRLSDERLGFLIADVSGKGTSAALYMAELKGLMLSLARIHDSPRDLLIAANQTIAEHIDMKSFITMSYVVIDLERQVMTYARAGHCPLIFLKAARPDRPRRVEVLAPDGLVVGLKLDDGTLFKQLLQEVTMPLEAGDLVVLFTDGFSEAMNESFDCFGEGRLSQLVEDLADLPFEQLRERIVREVRTFTGSADQHDDMTMLLLKVEAEGTPLLAGARRQDVAAH